MLVRACDREVEAALIGRLAGTHMCCPAAAVATRLQMATFWADAALVEAAVAPGVEPEAAGHTPLRVGWLIASQATCAWGGVAPSRG